MRIIVVFISLILFGCGNNVETVNKRSRFQKDVPISQSTLNYKVIGNITVDVASIVGLSLTQAITYTSTSTSTLSIINGDLTTPSEDVDGNILDLGRLSINKLKINKLKICGASGHDKCTSAIIRIYTNDLGGANVGLGGFVNITENYAEAPITVTGYSGDAIVGHTLANATLLNEYTIPNSDKKLTQTDFSLISFPLVVDFSNAGAGDYQMSIELEVAVGPMP